MYTNTNVTNIVGSFASPKDKGFRDQIRATYESVNMTDGFNMFKDIGNILAIDTVKEHYKESLLGDVLESANFGDSYLAQLPAKMEQLFENSAFEIIKESAAVSLQPIVGLTLPVLKKSFIEGHAKDIVMTEVPDKPIVNMAFERKFLKDAAGNKFYIPEIYYNNDYKEVLSAGVGHPVSAVWQNVPVNNFDVIAASGGSFAARDTLSTNFSIAAVKLDVDGELKTITTTMQPNHMHKGTIAGDVSYTKADGSIVTDKLFGQVDIVTGKVSIACTQGLVKQVQFGGNLSNENNIRSVELDREREMMQWIIPDGFRINTGITAEKIKDMSALFDIDITTDVINDMASTLAQTEDSQVLDFVRNSFDKWKDVTTLPFGYSDGFVEQGFFTCDPPANKPITRSAWVQTELKYELNQFIERLKQKLRTSDLMFVIYGNPVNVNLIQDDVNWIITDDTVIGGVQLDYQFGVYTKNKNRIHVVSTMKEPIERGLRIVGYPTTPDTATFKHLKYSQNIENGYRNPVVQNIPNIMGVNRYLTIEVTPLQGEIKLLDAEFALKDPSMPITSQCAKATVDLIAGTYTGAQTVTVTSATPGALLYFTVDGSEPTTLSTKLDNGGTVSIASTATLKVLVVKVGLIPSEVLSVEYTID